MTTRPVSRRPSAKGKGSTSYEDTIQQIQETIMTRNGWYLQPNKQSAHNRLVLSKQSSMYFVIPACVMAEDSVVMGHFEKSNLGDIWSIFFQFIIFVLKVAYLQLSEVNTPTGAYPIKTYLVPIFDENNIIIEYMLVINASPECPINLGVLFSEAAKSSDKVLNMSGHFIDLDPKRRQTTPHRPRKDRTSLEQRGEHIDVQGCYEDYYLIDSGGNLDKLLAVYARRGQAQTIRDMNAFEALKVENAITWISDNASPEFRDLANYSLPDDSGTIPESATYYFIDPFYCDPATFFVQIKPHLVFCDHEKAFNAELQSRLVRAASKRKAITENVENLELGNSSWQMPSWASVGDAHKALKVVSKIRVGEVHENLALATIRYKLRSKIDAIDKLFADGENDQKDREELVAAARSSVMSLFEKDCMHSHSSVSNVAKAYHQYAADNEHIAPMKVPISDPELSGMSNFQIYTNEVLSQHLGLATHSLIATDMWVILSSMFSTDPAHVLLVGDGGAGKSFVIEQLFELIGQFAKTDLDTQSAGRRWAGGRIFDGVEYTDEIDPSLLVNGGGTGLNELKALLTKKFVKRTVLNIDESHNNDRSNRDYTFVQQQSHLACMNKDEAALHGSIRQSERNSMEALMSRFFVLNFRLHNHKIRNVNSVSQGMGRMQLGRDKKTVVAEFVLLMRQMMIVQHLIFCEIIPDVDMAQFEAQFAKFDEVVSPHKVSNNIRQTPKIKRVAKSFALVRSVVEHFCIPGAPYYGKPYSLEAFKVMPLVCTFEDVAKACTSCFSMYIPSDLSTITAVMRTHINTLINDNSSQVTFSNPRTTTGTQGTFRKPSDGEDEQHAYRRRNAAAAGYLPGAFDPPDGTIDVVANAPQPVSYACLPNTGRKQLEKELWSLCHNHVSKPGALAMDTCLDILQRMKLTTSNWMCRPGMKPYVIEGDTRKLQQFAIEFSGSNCYINLELVCGTTIEYGELWRAGIDAMCDKYTIPRRILTSIPNARHPFLANDYRVGAISNKTAVSVNPEFVSRATSTALTGRYDPNDPKKSIMSRAQLIELDMDSDMYYLVQNYLRLHPLAAINEAVTFARMEHVVSKMARARAYIEENLPPGENLCFSVYPDERITEMDELIEAKHRVARGEASNATTTTTSEVIDLQRRRNGQDTRTLIHEGMRVLSEKNEEADPGQRLAIMYGFDAEEGMKTSDVVAKAMRIVNPGFYAPMALPAPPEDNGVQDYRIRAPAVINVREPGFVPPRVVRPVSRDDAQAPIIYFPDDDEDDDEDEEDNGVVSRKRKAGAKKSTPPKKRGLFDDDDDDDE